MDHSAAVEIFSSALDVPPADRAAFLEDACAGDQILRAEVESLLAIHERHPPAPTVDPWPAPPERVGRYPIRGELGRGGMGRVYIAEDPALGRSVALKMLPAGFLHGRERFTRFHREAQILASLNHPNVAVLYSLEQDESTPFLTMELVTGESLAARIAAAEAGGNGLELAETLRIATQVARALEFAHRRGVIHRDLKPANVAISSEDQVKVLDFGLAKVVAEESGAEIALDGPAPSAGSPGRDGDTLPGSVLGSPGYMSPEQIRGGTAGPATDLWALACIIFECLAGRPAFPGRTVVERMSATLDQEPDWTALPPTTPVRLSALLRECLVKDPRHRLSSARSVLSELDWIAADIDTGAAKGAGPVERSAASRLVGRTIGQRIGRIAAVVALAAAGSWFLIPRGRPPLPRPEQQIRRITYTGRVTSFDLAPDDRSAVYAGHSGELVLLDLESGNEKVAYRGQSLDEPSWSPDGSQILFSGPDSTGHWVLHLVSKDLGQVRRIGPVPSSASCWTADGRRILTTTFSFSDLIWRWVLIDPQTGDTTCIPGDPQIRAVTRLSCSPAGTLAISGMTQDGHPGIWITPGIGRPARRILEGVQTSCTRWSADGRRLLYLTRENEGSTLMQIALDPATRLPNGPGQIVQNLGDAESFRVFHHSGRILYVAGQSISSLWLLDRKKNGSWSSRCLLSGTFTLYQPRLSPDGRSVVVAQNRIKGNIIELSLDGGLVRVLASSSSMVRWPAWSPDGKKVAFQADQGADRRVWVVSASGGDPAVYSRQACSGYVYWYPDARLRYQTPSSDVRNYVFVDPAAGTESPAFRTTSRGTAFQSSVSPDGRWMAVAGNRNDRDGVCVWLVDLETSAERLLYAKVAAPIGWSRDGSWVYLSTARRTNGGSGDEPAKIVRVSVRDGRVEPVADLPAGRLSFWANADIAPDGARIVAAVDQFAHDLWIREGVDLATR